MSVRTPIPLTAGPLTALFEPDTGMLRYISYGRVEVWRGLYAAVRDENWGTVAPSITEITTTTSLVHGVESGVRFTAVCRRGPVQFLWRGVVEGLSRGEFRYSFAGETLSTFCINRIGFCLLHPLAECAGKPCRVTHSDGSTTEGFFPSNISPHQPFKDICAIQHKLPTGGFVEAAFSGDVFEMEDQRNWTDASFKTYCTPLEKPFPVLVESGTRITQSAVLRFVDEPRERIAKPRYAPLSNGIEPTVRFLGQRLPPIGLGHDVAHLRFSEREVARLRALRLSHLRTEVTVDSEHGLIDSLDRCVTASDDLGVALHLAVTLPGESDAESQDALRRLSVAVSEYPSKVASWTIFQQGHKTTGSQVIASARHALGVAAEDAEWIGGTPAYFAELNREPPDTRGLDAVVYSINPQVHAEDDASLVETLQAQPATLRSAKRLMGETRVEVGPITLRPRFNPNATGDQDPHEAGALPPQVDARQSSLFAAGWTLGSIAQLSVEGPKRLTYYDTIGWRGVMESENGSPLPQQFSSQPGAVFPLYHVLADLADYAGQEITLLDYGRPLEITALALRSSDGGLRVMVANHTAFTQEASVPKLEGQSHQPVDWRLRVLDAQTLLQATTNPERYRKTAKSFNGPILELTPYALLTLDVATLSRAAGETLP